MQSIQVEVLSPVHVGDGTKLIEGLDFAKKAGGTWVINQNALLEHVYQEDDPYADQLMSSSPADLLSNADFVTEPPENPLFRYVMIGEPDKRELNSHIKDIDGRAYLPGSTLKGMLRTIYVWGLYAARSKKPDFRRLSRSRSWAGQPIERQVMGNSPNTDLFRALHIGDTASVDLDRLIVRSIDVYPTGQRGGGVVTAAESLREETVLQAPVSLDQYGFENDVAANELGWSRRKGWLSIETIAQVGQAHAELRLRQEIEFFDRRPDARIVFGFYRVTLMEALEKLEPNQFLAQVGWGAGWNNKTLNNLIMDDERKFAEIVQKYRLTRKSRDFQPGDPFPKSRHLVRQNRKPVRPMGWVKVTLN